MTYEIDLALKITWIKNHLPACLSKSTQEICECCQHKIWRKRTKGRKGLSSSLGVDHEPAAFIELPVQGVDHKPAAFIELPVQCSNKGATASMSYPIDHKSLV